MELEIPETEMKTINEGPKKVRKIICGPSFRLLSAIKLRYLLTNYQSLKLDSIIVYNHLIKKYSIVFINIRRSAARYVLSSIANIAREYRNREIEVLVCSKPILYRGI